MPTHASASTQQLSDNGAPIDVVPPSHSYATALNVEATPFIPAATAPAKATPPPRRVMKPVPLPATNSGARKGSTTKFTPRPRTPTPPRPQKYRLNPYARDCAFEAVGSYLQQQQRLSYQPQSRSSSTPPPVWKAGQTAGSSPGLASIDLDGSEETVARQNLPVQTPPPADDLTKDFVDIVVTDSERRGSTPGSSTSSLRCIDLAGSSDQPPHKASTESKQLAVAAVTPPADRRKGRTGVVSLEHIRVLPSIAAVDAASIGQHSSSSPKKKQQATHILHKSLLSSQVSFYPFPSEAELQAMASDPAFTTPKVPKEEMARVFLGQLPYETSEVLVQWMGAKLAGGIKLHHVEKITKLERVVGSERYGTKIPTGCFHACVARHEVGKMLVGLHKKILVDDPGLWVAEFPGAVSEDMLPLHPTPAMPEDLLAPPQASASKKALKRPKISGKTQTSDFPSIGEAHGAKKEADEEAEGNEVSKEAQQDLRGLKMLKELRDHCFAMKLHRNLRISNRPYGAVVAQLATSTYDPDAVANSSTDATNPAGSNASKRKAKADGARRVEDGSKRRKAESASGERPGKGRTNEGKKPVK